MKTTTLIIASLILTGCWETPKQEMERGRNSGIKSETRYGDGMLYTIEHDGHMFVVEGRYGKGAMLHHPDCQCFKSIPANAP